MNMFNFWTAYTI